MDLNEVIKRIPFREILDEFVSLYLKEYGEIQIKEISQKVHSSNSVHKFLQETNIVKAKPLRDDFLIVIHSIFYFTFAKAEKIAFGAIVALCKWQKEVAIPNNLEDNQHLNETFFGILEKCNGFKINLSNSETFFAKFYKQIDSKFDHKDFRLFEPDNILSELAYIATEKQIKLQGLKHTIGKLDCYIFYSTYISLLTSYMNLSKVDDVEIYLKSDIKSYCKFLNIDEDSFDYSFNNYLEERANLFAESIQVVNEVDFETSTNLPIYLRLFEAENFTELYEVDDSNIDDLSRHFEILKENIDWINVNFKSYAFLSSIVTLDEEQTDFIKAASLFIGKLVIMPFKESRCNICGNFHLRENLELLPVYDDYARLLPVCSGCKAKFMQPSGWIELGFIE